jgi:hypothetical protein
VSREDIPSNLRQYLLQAMFAVVKSMDELLKESKRKSSDVEVTGGKAVGGGNGDSLFQ